MSGISDCAQSVSFVGLEHYGPFYRLVTNDTVNCFIFDSSEKHADGRGKIARAVLAAFTQGACETAVQSPGGEFSAVIVSLVCDFVDDGNQGERIEAQAKVVRRTNSLIFLTADVTANGRILLTANALAKRALDLP